MSVASFLETAGWHGAAQAALAQDGSARRYLRLRQVGETAVLMIAPPDELQAFRRFIAVADWLRGNRLSAPRIHAADEGAGLMLLEDFGTGVMAGLAAADPACETEMYAETGRVLNQLATLEPPGSLDVLDADRLVEQTTLLFDEMPDRPSPTRVSEWQGTLLRCLSAALAPASAVALRDFHAENVMWLPDRDGLARVGLLDFQDAVRAPPGYDLASLVDDPRRNVPEAIRDRLIVDHGVPVQQIDLLSLARNLRILGIFRRLARLRDRPAYLQYLPRTAWLIRRAALNPAAAPIRDQIGWVLAGYGLAEAGP